MLQMVDGVGDLPTLYSSPSVFIDSPSAYNV